MSVQLENRYLEDVGVICRSATTDSLHQGFQVTGPSLDNEPMFRWLDRTDAHPLVGELKRRMLELCPVDRGDHVLDVGCGLGHEVMRIARRVGRSGRVVGVDVSPSMVGEAQRRGAALPIPTVFVVGDAHHLEFARNTFDVCRTERVLRYLQNPEAALREMARVVRPGGWVLAFDFDSDQTVVDASDSALARRIAEVLDAAVPNPWVGRHLFALFHKIGLVDVRVVPHTIVLSGAQGFAMYQQLNQGTIARALESGQITAAEAAAWWADLDQAGRSATFFSVNLGFIVAGRKA